MSGRRHRHGPVGFLRARSGRRRRRVTRPPRIPWRGLRRRPLHAAAIVLLLVVGIAANAVVFAVTEKAIISPLAVEQPEALVSLGRLSYPNYRSFVDRLAGVSGVAAFVNQPLTFTEREPERLRDAFVTADYFQVLGVAAVRGRTFHSADPARVAVVSEHFWRTAWGADPEVVGRTLWLNDRAVTIAGASCREPFRARPSTMRRTCGSLWPCSRRSAPIWRICARTG